MHLPVWHARKFLAAQDRTRSFLSVIELYEGLSHKQNISAAKIVHKENMTLQNATFQLQFTTAHQELAILLFELSNIALGTENAESPGLSTESTASPETSCLPSCFLLFLLVSFLSCPPRHQSVCTKATSPTFNQIAVHKSTAESSADLVLECSAGY